MDAEAVVEAVAETVEAVDALEFEVDAVRVWHGGTCNGRVSVMIYTGMETIEVVVTAVTRRAIFIPRHRNEDRSDR